jgi:hypothetical protein
MAGCRERTVQRTRSLPLRLITHRRGLVACSGNLAMRHASGAAGDGANRIGA